MNKYIKVEYPEYQEFMDYPEFKECYFCTQDNSYFIPEKLYSKFTFILPDKYSDYTIEFDCIDRGQSVLVLDEDDNFIETESTVKWDKCSSLPIILKDSSLLDGINCIIVGVKK